MSQVERYWTMNIKKSPSRTQSHSLNVFCPVSADALKTLRWWRSLGISSWSPVANGHSLLDLGRAWKRINNTERTVFIIGGVLIKKSFFFEERRETFLAGLSLSPSFSCEFDEVLQWSWKQQQRCRHRFVCLCIMIKNCYRSLTFFHTASMYYQQRYSFLNFFVGYTHTFHRVLPLPEKKENLLLLYYFSISLFFFFRVILHTHTHTFPR